MSPAGYCEVTEELPPSRFKTAQGSQGRDPTAFLTFCQGSRRAVGANL